MADFKVVVANPTASDITSTIGSHVATAREATVLTLNDATDLPDLQDFIAGGCSVGPHDPETMQDRQQSGFLLYMLQQPRAGD